MKLWIRLDAAIRSDPNVAELAARLGVPFAEAVGLCALVWAGIAEHRPNGDLTGISISALENWAGWEPRKGKPAGSFGKAFRELFTTSDSASGWKDRQGKLIERMSKDRARKGYGNSAEFPEDSTPTVRNGTEQNKKPTTARVRARLLEADWSAFDDLLSRVSDPETWSAELDAMLEGMPGHYKAAPAQIGRAIRDMIANGKHRQPNIRQFRRYVDGAKPDESPKPSQSVLERAEWHYSLYGRYGLGKPRTAEQMQATVDRLVETEQIADVEQFKRELAAVKPSTWFGNATDFTRTKDLARIAQALAPLQHGAAA